MLPPSSKGTSHGHQSNKGPSLEGQNGQPGHLGGVGQTPKYLSNTPGLGGLNYNSNQSQSNGSLSLLPGTGDPMGGGKLFLPH